MQGASALTDLDGSAVAGDGFAASAMLHSSR